MCCLKNISLVVFIVLNISAITNSLEETHSDSAILRTEEIIRNTTNKLFSTLKLRRDNPRLNQYLIINKYFASLTLQDHDSINKIVNISRSDVENNGTTVFMAAINELLNADYRENSNNVVTIEGNDDQVRDIIESFISRLKEAKQFYEVNSPVNINVDVLSHVKGTRMGNTSWEYHEDKHDLTMGSEEIEFWKPSGRRIFKGQRTKIKYYPFMATVQIFNNFQCAGSIIKSDLIITASSCLQLAWNNRFYRENPAFLSVRVGSSFYNVGGEVIPVLEIYFHPSYDPKTLRNNIAIMRLVRKIRFSWRSRRRVRKIDIDRHDSNLPINTPGITILGWGAKGRSNVVHDPWQNILSFAVLDVYPLRECQDIYSREYVSQKNFCAGFMSKGGGACNRDVGGPGIDEGTLVGVVSFGPVVCGAVDAPTVFTKVGYYARWIEDIMAQPVPISKKRTTLMTMKPPNTGRFFHPKPTTFKIPPLPAKLKPKHINEVENALRIFDDDLFQDFLRTMFDSKEIAEYKNVFEEVKQDMIRELLAKEKQLVTEDPLAVTSPYVKHSKPDIKMVESNEETIETATESDYSSKYTVLDNEISGSQHFDKDLTKANTNKVISVEEELDSVENKNVDHTINNLIKKIDLNQIIDEETNNNAAEKDESEALVDSIESDSDNLNKNNSVLTLLYLSKENKDKFKDHEKITEDGKDLSINTDMFHDMTRTARNKQESNKIDIYKILPEKEIYQILSEVIDEEMQNITAKR